MIPSCSPGIHEQRLIEDGKNRAEMWLEIGSNSTKFDEDPYLLTGPGSLLDLSSIF